MSNRRLLDGMRERARIVRTRAAIRRWKYRRRDLAAGVWFRIRRVLADARDAYVISGDDAKQLLTEGYKAEACGAQLEPQKNIIFVDSMRLAHLESRRQIPVRLGPDFLLATAVALVPFRSRPSVSPGTILGTVEDASGSLVPGAARMVPGDSSL